MAPTPDRSTSAPGVHAADSSSSAPVARAADSSSSGRGARQDGSHRRRVQLGPVEPRQGGSQGRRVQLGPVVRASDSATSAMLARVR